MLKSMTAYGRADKTADVGTITVELQSVNRRFFEASLALPGVLSHLEARLRTQLRRELLRGSVAMRVEIARNGAPKLQANMEVVRELKEGWEKVGAVLGWSELSTDQWVAILAQRDDLFSTEEEKKEQWEQLLSEALADAIAKFEAMRQQEGAALAADLILRMEKLKNYLSKIEPLADGAVEEYRKKLEKRLGDLIEDSGESRDRILREIALYTDRADVSEEITRITSHFQQMNALIEKPEREGVGKKLDFLVQELLREYNTLGAKATDSQVVQLVIESKSELERIREQVQNVA